MTQTTRDHPRIPRGFYFQKPNNVIEQNGIMHATKFNICSYFLKSNHSKIRINQYYLDVTTRINLKSKAWLILSN